MISRPKGKGRKVGSLFAPRSGDAGSISAGPPGSPPDSSRSHRGDLFNVKLFQRSLVPALGSRTRRARRPSLEAREAQVLMAASFQGLGAFVADAVSPDGTVVVGSEAAVGAAEWTQDIGVVPLMGSSGAIVQGNATGVSENGAVVVGTVGGYGLATSATAFRWTGDGGAVYIAAVSSAYRSTANAVSEDGTIIAGDYKSTSAANTSPYVLTDGTDLEIIPVVNGTNVTATFDNTMSANGGVIAGAYVSPTQNLAAGMPYAWVNGQLFLVNGDGASRGSATAVSADGSVVVGEQAFSFLGAVLPFRWDPASGSGPTNLPLPSGFTDSIAAGVSNDGTTIVGWMAPSSELLTETASTAFIWDQATNDVTSLQGVLTTSYGLGSALDGWTLTEATAITPDGNTIVGVGTNPQGQQESWIVHLSSPTPTSTPTPAPTSTPTPTPTPTQTRRLGRRPDRLRHPHPAVLQAVQDQSFAARGLSCLRTRGQRILVELSPSLPPSRPPVTAVAHQSARSLFMMGRPYSVRPR